jgi:uncharacterized protein YdeI (YjbR/CyaY-like superfamily)
MEPSFFRGPEQLRRWFARNHTTKTEIWVGYYKKDSGKPSITWPESVEQALCFGWIDGVRKKVDEISYTNRFSPRQPKSNWSTVNIRRVGELTRLGLMADAGLAAFKARDEKRSGVYSFENRPQSLPWDLEKVFKANTDAWAFWTAQPPGYRRTLTWYVVSAVKDETRQSRLAKVIESSARGQRLGLLSPSASAKATDKSKKR